MAGHLSEKPADQKSQVSGQAAPWFSRQALGVKAQGQPQFQTEEAVTHPNSLDFSLRGDAPTKAA